MTKPFEIPKALVWKAFQRVRSNGGSAGIDQESLAVFERNLGNNLYKIWNRMGSGSYFRRRSRPCRFRRRTGAHARWESRLLRIESHKPRSS